MKIFVSGGAGFIGSNFIRYWIQHHPSDLIVNFDSFSYAGNYAAISDFSKHANFINIIGDI